MRYLAYLRPQASDLVYWRIYASRGIKLLNVLQVYIGRRGFSYWRPNAKRRNPIADALELRLFCIKPSIWRPPGTCQKQQHAHWRKFTGLSTDVIATWAAMGVSITSAPSPRRWTNVGPTSLLFGNIYCYFSYKVKAHLFWGCQNIFRKSVDDQNLLIISDHRKQINRWKHKFRCNEQTTRRLPKNASVPVIFLRMIWVK